MTKKSKMIYAAAVIIVIAIAAVLIGISVSNQKSSSADAENAPDVADVDPIALPSKSEITPVTDADIPQIDNLTDKYVLRKYDVDEEDNSITYYYQTHLATTGERLMIIAKPMTEEEYNAQLPTENLQSDVYEGIDFTFVNRTLYYLPEGTEVSEALQKLVDENYAEVEFGNTMEEAIDMQKMYWYNNGICYIMKAYYHHFDLEEMSELTHYFIDNSK